MQNIKITLPDNSVKELPIGVTGLQIAEGISQSLAKVAVGIVVNGVNYDLTRSIIEDSSIKLLTFNDPEGKAIFWHSSAHLLAEAVEDLFPGTKFGIGPSIEGGFYYDMEIADGYSLTQLDLHEIENKMSYLAKEDNKFYRENISWEEAVEFFKIKGDEFKLELLNDFKDREITFYKQGNFTDLCRGTHIPSTGMIKAIKLMNISAAYWKADQSRQQLQRVYGITFPKKSQLDEHLILLEEAKKRDHRKIGREMELFMFSQLVGQGLPIWLPKGAVLRENLEKLLRGEQRKLGYQQVITPHIGNLELYKTSGHYEKYSDGQFRPIEVDDEQYMLKPMNCPHHCQIYSNKQHSFRDLPIRLAEFGTVYRYEKSGQLGGLLRVRGFTQDDAHVFCRPDQVKEELSKVIELVKHVLRVLQLNNFKVRLSFRDKNNPKFNIGTDELWNTAENSLKEVTEANDLEYTVGIGEAAFYGPKIDFMVKDALKREWQLGTVQLDYNLPERFELEYIASDGSKQRPVMIHRAPFGSFERFTAVLIEHFAGNFPFWLAPVQAIILPLSEKYMDFAKDVFNKFHSNGIRIEFDDRNEKLGYKIREAEMQKIPYLIIIGEKEQLANKVSLRIHGDGDKGQIGIDELIIDMISLSKIENL
ncbi:MAG: threonine--tRNA ligase [Chlorobiota bacterium]|nr:threonine--tRNA ligase [Chlorobiota bacterium]QQS65577.1 MAG: threonine--tRNA ligase [Chlorobiota bacterium]